LAVERERADGGVQGDKTNGGHSSRLGLSDTTRAMRFLEGSAVPLKEGKEDCGALAAHSRTLGELVKKYQQKANREKSARCERRGGGTWACEASFVYNDKHQSEKDFALVLRLEVEDTTGKVLSLTCFLAG
jgi:hypothetical protein